MGDHLISPIVLIFKHIAHVCFFKHFHWIPHSITVLVEPPKVIMIICTRKQSYRWHCIFYLCSFFLKMMIALLHCFALLTLAYWHRNTKPRLGWVTQLGYLDNINLMMMKILAEGGRRVGDMELCLGRAIIHCDQKYHHLHDCPLSKLQKT